MRSRDLSKLVSGCKNELLNLEQMIDMINTSHLELVFKNIEFNTKYLVDASEVTERSNSSLKLMQVIFAGGLCFNVVDRISGGTLNVAVPDWFTPFSSTVCIYNDPSLFSDH